MSENAVIFKGTKEGLYIILKEEMDLDTIRNNLDKKIKPSKRFFEGAKIVNFKGKKLSHDEFDELRNIMQQEYGMTVTGNYEELVTGANGDKEEVKEPELYKKLPYDNVSTGEALIVRATVRSGQLIINDGSIVIVGDVNPGALLRATGSIVVMGAMRGVAHAGSGGDYGAFVAAYNFQPTQLRIGDIITRSPDGGSNKGRIPEMAVVKQGMIVVEPYLPRK